jgi:HD-like signal output (HDOD) protein
MEFLPGTAAHAFHSMREDERSMRIECPHCRKVYNVPDERLPKRSRVCFHCPACKGPIEMTLDAPAPDVPRSKPGPAVADDATQPDFKAMVLRKLKDLPPMPQIVFKAREIIGDPDSEMRQLADLLESDQAIATKVLKLANSAYYGLAGKVSSIRHASSLLGYKTLGQLISMAGTASVLGKSLNGYGLDANGTWRHSLIVGTASKIIALEKHPDLESDAFAAGLIHDVGKLILDPHVYARKEAFDRFTAGGRNSMLAAEQRILGFDHAEIGFEVCRHWNIPVGISHAIQGHHNPTRSDGDALTYMVYMANAISNVAVAAAGMQGAMALMDGIEAFMYMIDDEALAYLSMDQKHVARILVQAQEAVEKITAQLEAVA